MSQTLTRPHPATAESAIEDMVRRAVRDEVRSALAEAREVDPLITQRDAARRAGVSVRTWARWRVAGLVPAPDLRVGGVARWRASSVEAALEEMERPRPGGRGRG